MKKKILYILPFLLFSIFSNAQSEHAGQYHFSSGNHDDGGYSWLLFDDHQFVMVSFGTFISGTWEEKEDDTIIFSPNAPSESFQIYGRKTDGLAGSRIKFSNLDINEKVYIGFNSETLQPILNKDANCLKHPIVETFEKVIKDLYFSNTIYNGNLEGSNRYHIKTEGNNDFIVQYNNRYKMLNVFSGNIINDQLIFDGDGKSSVKSNIDNEDDDVKELKAIIQTQKRQYNRNSLLVNPRYRVYDFLGDIDGEEGSDEIFEEMYNYNSEAKIYLAKEPDDTEGDYHNSNTLSVFTLLPFSKVGEGKNIIAESLLNYNCN